LNGVCGGADLGGFGHFQKGAFLEEPEVSPMQAFFAIELWRLSQT